MYQISYFELSKIWTELAYKADLNNLQDYIHKLDLLFKSCGWTEEQILNSISNEWSVLHEIQSGR